MKVAYIDQHKQEFGVQPICDALKGTDAEIAPSTYKPLKHLHVASPSQRCQAKPFGPRRVRVPLASSLDLARSPAAGAWRFAT